MSLKSQAAEMAQEKARVDRERADSVRRKKEVDAEEWAHAATGVIATFVAWVQVAKVVDKGRSYDRHKVVEHEEMAHVRIDDVDLLLKDTHSSYTGGQTKFEASIGAEHPEYGWYLPADYHHFYRPTDHDSMTDEELLAKFLPALAEAQRRAKYDHPVERIRKEGEFCPTCRRGY